jgi:hypothetical protein
MARVRIVRNWQLGTAATQFESEMTLALRRRTGFEADWSDTPNESVVDLVVEFALDADYSTRAGVAAVVEQVVSQTITRLGDERARLVEFLGGAGDPLPAMYVPAQGQAGDTDAVSGSENDAPDS